MTKNLNCAQTGENHWVEPGLLFAHFLNTRVSELPRPQPSVLVKLRAVSKFQTFT